MEEEWRHKFTDSKQYPSYGPKHRIKVEAGLHHLRGNALAYFSVTGEIGIPGARDCECCGSIHDLILPIWPELAPVIALHLSDSDGKPMYVEANGWYQLAGYYCGAGERYHAGDSKGHHSGQYRKPTPDECLQQFADYVRISLTEAKTLAEGWRCDDDPKSSRRWFGQWLDGQSARFLAEAEAACTLLDALQEAKK